MASVQSLLAVLQEQIHTSSHEAAQEVRAPLQAVVRKRLTVERSELDVFVQSVCLLQAVQDSSGAEALRVQLAQKEEELQRMKDEVQEMNLLRQQNYLLQSKVQHTCRTASVGPEGDQQSSDYQMGSASSHPTKQKTLFPSSVQKKIKVPPGMTIEITAEENPG